MPSQKQINEFATDIVDSWDLETTIAFAIEVKEDQLQCMAEGEFIEEWETFYDEKFKEE